jgi:hypothetical protein
MVYRVSKNEFNKQRRELKTKSVLFFFRGGERERERERELFRERRVVTLNFVIQFGL